MKGSFLNLKIRVTKSILLEIAFLVGLLLLAFIFREKPLFLPSPSYLYNESNSTKINPSNSSEIKSSSQTKDTLAQNSSKVIYSFLKKRNPFSPEGSYSGMVIPENPYTLIAVKGGKPSEAILKAFTGELLKVKVGDKLLDGSEVVKITENSVILKRLGKERELRIFKIEVDKWKPKKPFGS
ncbi:MAG: hypothetical protein N3A56_08130 [Thermodesulfobacteriaceae bacterium]|nr:hypothetical protein [Thermodesulfobacteriaceae bacterium]